MYLQYSDRHKFVEDKLTETNTDMYINIINLVQELKNYRKTCIFTSSSINMIQYNSLSLKNQRNMFVDVQVHFLRIEILLSYYYFQKH